MKIYIKEQKSSYAQKRNPKDDCERIKFYLKDRIKELKNLANSKIKKNRNVEWLKSALSFIDFLSSHVYNSKSTKSLYEKIVKEYLYPDKEITINDKNLAYILYTVARCGCVHNFSLSPFDKEDKQTFYLTNINDKKPDENHLEKIQFDLGNNITTECVILVAENFIEDIEKCVNTIIDKTKEDEKIKENLLESFEKCPPIGWFNYKQI